MVGSSLIAPFEKFLRRGERSFLRKVAIHCAASLRSLRNLGHNAAEQYHASCKMIWARISMITA
ncbi:hypothetical protein ABIF20_005273 [Bradyrhizobium japonicum]|uniref:hypothetical protein n=1 Tax=Bradyrhizobium japonicum TaxID=375 RepID=UPI003835A521